MIAKFLSLFWIAVAVLLWAFMTSRDSNLLVSILLRSALLAWTLYLFRLRPLAACIGAAVAFVTGFMFVCMIAGDWSPQYRIASTCIAIGKGDLHIHHMDKGWAVALMNAVLIIILGWTAEGEREQAVRRFGRKILKIAFGLLIVAVAFAVFKIGNLTLWVDAAGYATYCAMLGMVCREGHTERSAFRFYVAVSFSIALAVLGNGAVETFHDMLRGGRIPPTFIFWYPKGDPACH